MGLPPQTAERPCGSLRAHPLVSTTSESALLCHASPLSTIAPSFFTASIIKLVYGIDVADKKDPNVALMIRTLEGVQGFTSGRVLVQYLPFLRHVPLWVPVLGWQLQELAGWRAAADEVKQVMFDQTRDDLVSRVGGMVSDLSRGANVPSIMED